MARIFLCYRREDTGHHIPALLDSLRTTLPPEAIFVDKVSLNAGDDFRLRIYEELYNADAVLALIGEKWGDRFGSPQNPSVIENEDHLRVELETALRLRKTVIPVIIAPAKLPDSNTIPKTIADLPRLNAFGIDMEDLTSLTKLSSAVKISLDHTLDARVAKLASNLGINPGAIHLVLNGVRNAAKDAANVEMIGASEICHDVISHAKSKFGAKWKTALTRLGIKQSEDVGIIVYSLILENILEREPTDQPSDFWGIDLFPK